MHLKVVVDLIGSAHSADPTPCCVIVFPYVWCMRDDQVDDGGDVHYHYEDGVGDDDAHAYLMLMMITEISSHLFSYFIASFISSHLRPFCLIDVVCRTFYDIKFSHRNMMKL